MSARPLPMVLRRRKRRREITAKEARRSLSTKKQTESQTKLAVNQSASTESEESKVPTAPLRPKRTSKSLVSTTPIPPPKPLTFPHPLGSSGLRRAKSSSQQSKLTEDHSALLMIPSSISQSSLPESPRPMVSKLTRKEQQKKKSNRTPRDTGAVWHERLGDDGRSLDEECSV